MSPVLSKMIADMVRTHAGRHKLYASCIYPLLNRLGFAGFTGLSVLPESIFWQAIQNRAAQLRYPGCLGYFFGPDDEFWQMVEDNPVLAESVIDAFHQVINAEIGPQHPLVGMAG